MRNPSTNPGDAQTDVSTPVAVDQADQQVKTPSTPVVQPSDVVADRQAVLDLWRRNLPEGTTDRYDWLYATGQTRNWIARDAQNRVVGSIGLMARRMRLFGEEYPCGQTIDLNVDRRYRLGWLALQLQRAVAANVDEGRMSLIYGLPNPQSEAVARRANYDVVGPVQRWARPLQSYEYLHDRLPGGPLGRTAAAALDTAIRLRSPESRYHRSRDHRVEVTDTFDERFDRLWDRASRQYPVIGQRTADYLNWRFRQAPHTSYRALTLADRHDHLLAYLVYTAHDGVGYLADFLHADESAGDAVMAEFIRMMRVDHAKGIVTIFTGARSVTRRLRRFGFQRRPSTWKIMLHADLPRLAIPRYKLLDVNNWFLTRADVDTEF